MGAAPTVIDTHAMAWEVNDGIPGAQMKVLERSDEGWPSVLVNWLPAGLASDTPHRHYHRTVREHGLVLDGELPMAEYETLDDTPGVAMLFRAGIYMDRSPGCVHGLDPTRSAPTGFTILEWRTGPGTYLTEERAAQESIVEDAPATTTPMVLGPPGIVIERDDLRLLDTRELPWESADIAPGARRKRLSPAREGRSAVDLLWLGPGVAELPGSVSSDDSRIYVLDGELIAEDGTRLGPGFFMASPGGSELVVTAGVTGCTLLRF